MNKLKNYRIEKKDTFTVAGMQQLFATNDGGEDFDSIANMWAQLTSEQLQQLFSVSNGAVTGTMGVSSERGQAAFTYMIGTTTHQQTGDFHFLEFPALSWVIFDCKGALPHAMWNLKKTVLDEWLLESGFQQASSPRIEVYPQGDMASADYHCELWIPLANE